MSVSLRLTPFAILLFSTSSLAAQSVVEAEGGVAKSDSQTAADAKSVDDHAIVITGARTRLPATALPLTVDVLSGEELERQVAVSGSVIDALSARMPSFSPTREKLSGSGETLRGRSPLYAINNVPQSTPIRDGSRDGYTIDPFFIDRVEVIYGSNALQGIGATGGVVNQVTLEAPRQDGWTAQTLVQGTVQDGLHGSNMGGKIAGAAGYRSGAFDVVAGTAIERRGAFLDGDGNRIGVDGTQGEIQDSDSWSLFGRFGYQISPTARVEVVANRFSLEGNGNYLTVSGNRNTDTPATTVKGDILGDAPSNRAELLSLSFTEEALAGGALTAQLFFSRTRDIFGGGTFATFQDPAIDPSGKLFDQSVNKSRKIGGKLTYERFVPGLEALTMTAGLDALSDRTAQTLAQTGREWVPETTFRSIAPFLQGNLKLIDGRLRLVGGLRYENVELDVPDFTTLAFYGSRDVVGGKPTFDDVLVNGGIVAEPIAGLRAYASYAEGYTIADVGRILRGISTDGVEVENYLDLKPVVSNNREVGVEWKRGALQASATYFWSKSKLGSLLLRGADGIFSVLRQPIEIEGLEVNAEWRTPLPGLTLGGAYAALKGRTDTNQDGDLDADLDGANISPDRLNLHADYRASRWDARVAMRSYFERKFDGQPAVNDFGGYTLFDAAVGYRVGAHRLSLSAANIFDKQHTTYFSDTQEPTTLAGRANDMLFFAGRGRTITFGLTSSF
ncbi:TonB-dependent receptor [Sphingomonas sp. HDW15A]|uniref:TonB-dependent receptor n=1 Tax=Sphingomonas sp. HDW15A TaxID=2714942 RepID=UPI00140B997F|nr:TonB-dependent receptor [Sphingomonas sp. HDW15A]QIK95635.1 TonB-dependent receptor [Sphingomonas sp. HDW15A]